MSNPKNDGRKIVLLVLFALTVGCGAVQTPPEPAVDPIVEAPAIENLVTAQWLSQHLDDPDLVVLDCTVRVELAEDGGRSASERPGRLRERPHPVRRLCRSPGRPCRRRQPDQFRLPTPEQFCAAMGALGVGDDSRVVLYDGFSSVWAARVWWMLRWVGFDRAALLDGGLKAWTAEDGRSRPSRSDGLRDSSPPAPRPELIADRDEVLAAIGDDTVHHRRDARAPLQGRDGHVRPTRPHPRAP